MMATETKKDIQPEVVIETITPAIAETYLGVNVNFRRLATRKAKEYAKDIAAGKWDLNGEAIKFDTNGNLVDGQTRMKGCIIADRAFTTFVVRGIAPLATENLDGAVPRSFSQILENRGEVSTKNLAACFQILYRYFNGDGFFRGIESPTKSELLETYQKHGEVRENLKKLSGITRVSGFLSMHVALHYLFSIAESEEKADAFYFAVINGANLEPDDSRLLLRNRLMGNKISKTRLLKREVAALVIKSWNFYLQERPVKKLAWASVGDNPEPFPEILSTMV